MSVEAVQPTVKMMAAVVRVQLMDVAVQVKAAECDAVRVTTDHRSEVGGIWRVRLDITVPEHDIFDAPATVWNAQRDHDRPERDCT
jgi:hypothetical protein